MSAFYLVRVQRRYDETAPLLGLLYGDPRRIVALVDEFTAPTQLEFAQISDPHEGFAVRLAPLGRRLPEGRPVNKALEKTVEDVESREWVSFERFIAAHEIDLPAEFPLIWVEHRVLTASND